MDWTTVLKQAIGAAANAIGAQWNNVSASAEHAIDMLTQTAEYIANNNGKIPAPQEQMLVNNQKLAMQNALLGYEGVGILLAEQAVAAAWGIIGQALQTAAGKVL